MPKSETTNESFIPQAPAEALAVRSALADKACTQAELGDALGLSQQAISRRMTGETGWSVAELKAAARFLDVPPARFLEPSDEPTDAGHAPTALLVACALVAFVVGLVPVRLPWWGVWLVAAPVVATGVLAVVRSASPAPVARRAGRRD